ncbi:MAG: DUF6989 domain-containing protein [Candidatus Thorarchaeota archaeon]
MNFTDNQEYQDLAIVHIVFAALCIGVLLMPGVVIGAKMLSLVAAYNILVPLTAYLRGRRDWLPLWFYALVISIFQIFPDWFLAAQLETITFPDDGFFMIGPVSAYMAGLWAIPLFAILFVGLKVKQQRSYKIAYLVVIILTLSIFGLAEETMWMLPSWSAQNVAMVGHVAVYIVIPEILLGLSTLISFELVREKPIWLWIIGAFTVMILYLGNVSFFYLLIERILPAV